MARADLKMINIMNARRLVERSFYAPKTDCIEDVIPHLRFRDTGELVNLQASEMSEIGLRWTSYADRLRKYFNHEEATAWPPNGTGLLSPRHVIVDGLKHIGKETDIEDDDTWRDEDERLRVAHLSFDDDEGVGLSDVSDVDLWSGNYEEQHSPPSRKGGALKAQNLSALARATGINVGRLRRLDRHEIPMLPHEAATIKAAMRENRGFPLLVCPSKPTKLKHKRNLTECGALSTKGDVERKRIAKLRPRATCTCERCGDKGTVFYGAVPRLRHLMGDVVTAQQLYHWKNQHTKLAPEHMEALRAALAVAEEQDAVITREDEARDDAKLAAREARRKARREERATERKAQREAEKQKAAIEVEF